MRAGTWRKLARFYTAPGFAAELMHLYLATDLRPADGERLDARRGRAPARSSGCRGARPWPPPSAARSATRSRSSGCSGWPASRLAAS